MSIESALVTYLESKTEITNLVSTRIYPVLAPQNTTSPYITYQMISDSPNYCTSGDAKLNEARIQINAFDEIASGATGNSYKTVKQIQEALRDVLSGFRGTWGSTFINRCVVGGFSDLPQSPDSGREIGVSAVTCDLTIHYTVAAPSGV